MAVDPSSSLRLCRLHVWPNYPGLGFTLEQAPKGAPHIIRLVESNSPAAAGGLRIQDVVLQVNGEDVEGIEYEHVKRNIQEARDRKGLIELLVCDLTNYQKLKKNGIKFNTRSAIIMETPATIPAEYMNMQQRTPRTCQINLRPGDDSFGFEVANGEHDTGAYIQDVTPNSPAALAGLRKSDRIIEIDGKKVNSDLSASILDKLRKAKAKRTVRLFVADTDTYQYYRDNKMTLSSRAKTR
ncbi:unnamed protein product, partial [Didymodactylos carnosus]